MANGTGMSTGAKVAIGCLAAVVVGGVVVAALVFGGVWWAKGKAEQFTSHESRIEELTRKANAVPFTPPADGLIQEDRLLKFLEVRKRMFAVYERHRDDIEKMSRKKQGDLGDLATGIGVFGELRAARAEALADVGMSEVEYGYLVNEIYKSMMGSVVAQESGGKSVSRIADETYGKATQGAAETRQLVEKAEAEAPRTDASLTPEQRKMMADGRDAARQMVDQMQKAAPEIEKQAAQMRENARAFDAPPANIALYRKYEPEIKKYAMAGLEWLGL